MFFQMLCERFDLSGEKRNLDLGGTGILFVLLMFAYRELFLPLCKHFLHRIADLRICQKFVGAAPQCSFATGGRSAPTAERRTTPSAKKSDTLISDTKLFRPRELSQPHCGAA
jgi:hypothetical protein